MTEEIAIFAAGCFWGIEEHFRTIPGVVSTEVGYTGGHLDSPSYQAVCRGDTEHAEAVRITFNNEQISFDTLLMEFWACHDPTQKDRQGLDVGRQYRSVIFYIDAEQQHAAESAKIAQSKNFSRPIATEICPAVTFYLAEDYHQQYIAKRRGLL